MQTGERMFFAGGFTVDYLISLLYSIPAVLIALCFHEYAHAWMANNLGDPTAKNMGRMTIDPTKHLDLIGTICMLLFRFGWAKPVPINPRNFKKPKRDEILVSVSGVAMNLLVAFVAYGIYFVARYNGLQNEIFYNIVYPVVTLNIFLAVFNILPIPPLDGFHIVSALFIKRSNKVIEFLYRFGFIILIVLLLFGVISQLFVLIANPILYAFGSFYALFV